MLTDNTQDPISKYNAGTSLIVFGFISLLFPNLIMLLREWIIVFMLWLKKNGYINAKEFYYIRHCEAKRRAFVLGHNLKPKKIVTPSGEKETIRGD